jgi:acid phosphatase type 7
MRAYVATFVAAHLFAVADAASGASARASRQSLFGTPVADVIEARERLSASQVAFLHVETPLAASARLDLTLLAPAVPSGVARARLDWQVPAGLQDVAVTVHCGGGAVSSLTSFADSLLDLLPVPPSTTVGSRELPLPAVAACLYEAHLVVGAGAALASSAPPPTTTRLAILASASAPPLLGNDTDPVGTRLSFGDAPGDVQFTWTSMNATSPAIVRVGTTPGGPYPLTFTNNGVAPHTYTTAELCHPPANESSVTGYLFPGYFHTVPVLGLPADGSTFYAVYGQEDGLVAPEVSFRTRLPPGPDVFTRFAAFGDSATYPVFPGTVTTIDLVLAEHEEGAGLNFTAVIGDLGYAEGSTLVWALWTGLVFPVASLMPFQVTVGNHETNTAPGSCSASADPVTRESTWTGPFSGAYGDDSGGEGGLPTFRRYRAPPSSAGHGVFWYSLDVGSVHFVLLSSEHDYTPGSAQRAWLDADLAGVDRATTPWLVVGLHRPVYNGFDDSDYAIAAAAAGILEPLFLASKVDLVLAGHYHSYFRTTSVHNFTADPTGASPVYITAGTGGATYHNETVLPGARPWTAATDAEWGFGIVEAFNRSALRWTFRRNAEGGAVGDEVWIVRGGRGGEGEGAAAVAAVANPYAPEQIHLTLDADPDAIVVTWTSFESAAGGPGTALVESGPGPDSLLTNSSGTAWVYAVDSCPDNSTRAMHTVTFPCPRGVATYYRVSGDGGRTWSGVQGPARTPALRADGSFAVSLFGDMGINTAPAPNSVAALVNDTRDALHDLLIHFGDTAYNMNTDCGRNGDAFLRAVGGETGGYAGSVPVVWGNGNHETGPLYDYSEFLNRLAPGQAALSAASNSSSVRWVAWEIEGAASFFMVDTDAWIYPLVYPLVQPQWEWLRARLALVNRSRTPWVVVIGHRAMYCTKTDDGECNSEAQTLRYGQLEQYWGLEALLVEAGADFYFAGHTHHYEMTWPVREGLETQTNYVDPAATIHIQSGIAGTGPGGDPFAVPQETWERFRDTSYSPSYGRLVFVNASVARYTQYFAENRSVLDEAVIVRTKGGY